MAPRRLLETAPAMPLIFACSTCSDSGLIPIAGAVLTERYSDLFRTNIPCVCDAADIWRIEFQLLATPPKCECGRRAVYCLLTERPVCRGCFDSILKPWRANGAAPKKVERGESAAFTRITEADIAAALAAKGRTV